MDFAQKRGEQWAPTDIIFPRKFDTAIRDSFSSKFFRSYQDNSCSDLDILLITKHPMLNHNPDYSTSQIHYPLVLSAVLDKPVLLKGSTMTSSLCGTILKSLEQLYRIQIQYAHSLNHTHIKTQVLASIAASTGAMQIPIVLQNLLHLSLVLSKVVTQSNIVRNTKFHGLSLEEKLEKLLRINSFTIPILDCTFIWSYTYTVIKFSGVCYLVPKSILLMYHNKISDLVSVLLLLWFGQGTLYQMNDFTRVLDFLQELIVMAVRYDTDFFHIVKVLEGLGIAETLSEVEEWKNYEFLDCITLDLQEKVKFDYLSSRLRYLISSSSITLRHEMMCLSKILGHPLVSMEAGSVALHKRTTLRTPINMFKVQECINYFKRDYIKKNIAKTNKWPPCRLISSQAPKALQMAYIYSCDPDSVRIQQKFGKVNIDAYAFVELGKNMVFNKLENIIPHLKDKTISILRSQVMNAYINRTDPKVSWKDTRLLLAYLLNPTMVHDHVDYLEKYTASDDLEELLNYLVIRIVPKEKELKVDYRGFGCKTYEDRHRSLAQEKNVMQFLDEFSDDQAMTVSELGLLKKLDAFRRISQAYTHHTPLYIVIDSSAWNNRFRKETVDDMMVETLDKIFDYPIFSKTHKAFEKTLFYVPDIDGTYYWDGQAGGIEGLNQDTWVVCYINQIKVALKSIPFKTHILCKGDDLRIVVLIPNEHLKTNDLQTIKNQIVTSISETASEFGHQINVEESYGSCKYLAFSKSASILNIELPQTFRKIQKCYGANNAFINTLDDYIASTFSNAHSACKVTTIVSPCYKVSVFWSLLYLTTSDKYCNLTIDELTALLLVPSLLGGFPIIYLHNMCIRAESDLLSPFLGLIQFCTTFYPQIADLLTRFCSTPYHRPICFLGLYKDPYSLPSSKPPLASNILRSFIGPAIHRLSKNQDIQELLRAAKSPVNQDALNVLDSASVKRVKILSVLYSATPAGILDELLRKFESGRSVLELLILRFTRGGANRILTRVMKADNRLHNWRLKRISTREPLNEDTFDHMISTCPAESAYKIREYCWGHKIEDITMPPMQHQMSFQYMAQTPDDAWTNNNHFTYYYTNITKKLTPHDPECYSTGDRAPFLGFTTRSGMIEPTVHFVEKDVILTKVKNMVDLISWTNVSIIDLRGQEICSNAYKLIEKLLGSYTDTKLTDIAPFSGKRKSGTSQHHMRSPNFRESIVPNVLSNLYTRFYGESNSHITLRTSKNHFRMNFLHCYCWANWIGYGEYEVKATSTVPRVLWGVTANCHFCNVPIEEAPIIFNEQLIKALDMPHLRITNLGLVAEDILRKSIEEFSKKALNLPENEVVLPIGIAVRGIMQEVMDTYYHKKIALQDRFTHHVLHPEAHQILTALGGADSSRYIGLTEIKRIPVQELVDYLFFCIANSIPSECKTFDSHTIENWLISVPSSELPWFSLVGLIYEAGRLENVMRQIHRQSNIDCASSYYNKSLACRYLVYGLLKVIHNYKFKTDLVILSYYNSGQLKIHVRNSIEIQSKTLVKYISSLNLLPAHILIGTPIEHVEPYFKLCLRGLIMYTIIKLDDNDLTEIVEHLQSVVTDTLYIIDELKADPESVEELYHAALIKEIPNREVQTIAEKLSIYLEYAGLDFEMISAMHYDAQLEVCLRQRDQNVIKVAYTTLSDCIKSVRLLENVLASDMVDALPPQIDPIHGDFEQTPHLHSLALPFPSITIESGEYLPPQVRLQIEPIVLNSGLKYSINPQYLHRVTGRANSSSNHLLDVLTGLKIINRIPDYTGILCLSDGLGGFSLLLSCLTKHSNIIFHTIPDDPNIEIHPSTALNHQTSNHLKYQFLNQGYTSLSSPHTYHKILQEQSCFSIITCDIDYNENNHVEYQAILLNIVNFYLENRTINGLLICKLDLRYPVEIIPLMDILRQHCLRLHLTIPKGITFGASCYLIGYGTVTLPIRYTLETLLPGSQFSTKVLSRFIRTRSTQLERLATLERQAYNLTTFRISIPNDYKDVLGHFGFNRVSHILGSIIDTARLNILKATGPQHINNHFLQSIGLNPNRRITYLTKQLEQQHNIIHHERQSYDTNTQSHRRHLLRLLFFCYGLNYALSQFTHLQAIFQVSYDSAKEAFLILYEKLHRRDKTELVWNSLVLYNAKLPTNDSYLVSSYFLGINLFLSIYSDIKQ